MSSPDIFDYIVKAAKSGRAQFFFDARIHLRSCAIADIIFSFELEEEGSITVRHQNLTLMWIRETPGWGEITAFLLAIPDNADADSSEFRRMVYGSLLARLASIVD